MNNGSKLLRRDKDHEQIIESHYSIILNISEVSYINLYENPSEKIRKIQEKLVTVFYEILFAALSLPLLFA